MPTLLQIDSSPMGEDSVSRQLTREFAQRWRSVNPEGTVISRDLNAVAIPVVEAAWVNAIYTPEESRTADQKDLLWLSGQFARELLKADEYVVGVPVHNLGLPASLKLWVDHTVTPFGPRLDGKRATWIITAGRLYGPGSGNAARNYVEPWLRTLFGRLGVTNMHFILADGTLGTKSGTVDRAAFLAPHIDAIQALFADAMCP
ncbi:MAG TPA: NAD(P)H-dependent oxidoreductase [Candidatus Acidoferrum sp.]|jgi:FMN-dependent NADH-azoreductase|nr:NAD(P)H-dependent oxidoreductase [Candidatus Acidoferrum sp.]